MTNRTKGFGLAALSAAAYGVNPFAVIMYSDGMSVDSVLACRYLLAIVLMTILMIVKKESFAITLKEGCMLGMLGLLFSGSSLTLFESYRFIDVSIASTLLFCYPAMVAIIMMAFFRERPNIITIGAIVFVFIGIMLLNSGGDNTKSNIIGVLVVVVSSLLYAIYIVCVQKSQLASMSSMKVSYYSIVFGSLVYIVRLKMLTELDIPSTPRAGICAIILAVFPTIISITALAQSIKYIGSTNAAIMGALEPVTAVLLGVIVFSERPSLLAVLGMIIVFVAVTVLIAAPKIFKRHTNNRTA
ncbi:MAG: DMT family transporter [Bacteroidales bacterium]|nr:DMT family transporter [Bacteroidales bacterium]